MADDRTDPRYDPAFQRGYDGPVRTSVRDSAVIRRQTPAAPTPVRPAPPAEDLQPVGVPLAAPRAADAAPIVAIEASGPRDVTRNPFYVAVAALAVVMIVAGIIWLVQGFASIADDRTTTAVGYYAAMVMSFGAPILIAIGVCVVVGLLFVLGRHWRRSED